MQPYKFYMQECDKHGNVIDGTLKDLEEDFKGWRYGKCVGIEEIGTPKNIYTETYSDANRDRVYIPDVIMNAATEITLTFYVFGGNMLKVRDEFDDYIRHGYHRFWDTARNKYFVFYVKDKLKVNKTSWTTDIPYVECSYTLANIYGKTFNV